MGTATKQQNKVPTLRFSEFDGEWKNSTLGQESTFHDGQRVPLKQEDREKRRGSYRYYGASSVIDYVDDYIFDGDFVLLGEDGANIVDRSSRLAFLVSGKFWVNNHAHVIEAKGSPYFLAEYLETIRYDKYNTGTAQPKLNAAICKKIPITIPEVKEQQKIADFLGSVDDWLDNLRSQKTALETYKRGMMQKLFSQQIRFKDEGGDDFPEWEERKLGDVGDVVMCKRILKQQTSSTGDIPFFKIGTFGKEPDAFISQELYDEYKQKYSFPRKGDILISASGTIGRLVVYGGRPSYFQDSNIIWLANDENVVINKFLFHLYSKIQWPTASATIARLYNSAFRGIKISTPSIPEQQKIADFLTSLDKSIESKQQQITKAEEWKKGLMQKMFI